MWQGIFPAVTTKFTAGDTLDIAEMERCFALQVEAGVDGLIVCGSLGEAMALEPDEKIEILKTAKRVAGRRPVLMTVCESSTRRAARAAEAAAAVPTVSWCCRACPTAPPRTRPCRICSLSRARRGCL